MYSNAVGVFPIFLFFIFIFNPLDLRSHKTELCNSIENFKEGNLGIERSLRLTDTMFFGRRARISNSSIDKRKRNGINYSY